MVCLFGGAEIFLELVWWCAPKKTALALNSFVPQPPPPSGLISCLYGFVYLDIHAVGIQPGTFKMYLVPGS